LFYLNGRVTNGASSMGFSNNNGSSWQILPNTNYISIQFSSQNVAWISGENKIARLNLE